MTRNIGIAVTAVIVVVAGLLGWHFLGHSRPAVDPKVDNVAALQAERDNLLKQLANGRNAKLGLTREDILAANIETALTDPAREELARMLLAPDAEPAIHFLVEHFFTKKDAKVVAYAGKEIYRIGGESAIGIVYDYIDDPRAIVRDNAQKWYKTYNPGAILDRIDCPRETRAIVPTPTPITPVIPSTPCPAPKAAPTAPAATPSSNNTATPQAKATYAKYSRPRSVVEVQEDIGALQSQIDHEELFLSMDKRRANTNYGPSRNSIHRYEVTQRENKIQSMEDKLAGLEAELDDVTTSAQEQ